MTLLVQVRASHGVPFNVRRVNKGDLYGLDWSLTWAKDEPMIEFYDARYMKDRFGPFGQFITRYNASTIMQCDGLCLNGGVHAWRIDADALHQALCALVPPV